MAVACSRKRRFVAPLALGLGAVSCGRIGFDLLPSGSQNALVADASSGGAAAIDSGTGGASSGGGTMGSGGTAGTGGAPASGGGIQSSGGTSGATGGSSPVGDAASGGSGGSASGGASSGGASNGGASTGGTDAGATGGATSGGSPGTGGAPDAGPGPVCQGANGALRTWTFDSTVDGWVFWPNIGTSALSWTAATGNPTSGALMLDVTSGTGLLGWVVMDSPAPNLTGQIGSVWLWLDTPAATAGVKLYSQSNVTAYAWADGGFVTIAPRTWTCVTINFDLPVYKDATYDAASVVRFGIEVSGTGPFRIYADQISY